MITCERTLIRHPVHVLSVRSAFEIVIPCWRIWILIAINTSAASAESVLVTAWRWRFTDGVIRERNHLSVWFVASDLCSGHILSCTAEFTADISRTSVVNVVGVLLPISAWKCTDELILAKNLSIVLFVVNDFHGLAALNRTAEFTVERNCWNASAVTAESGSVPSNA